MAKTFETSIEISGVLSPSLQAAIKNAVSQLEEMSEETLEAAGAAQRLAAEISTQESVLRSLEQGYADFVVSGEESTEEARALADHIQKVSSELDQNRDTIEAAERAARDLINTQDDTADAYDRLERQISEQEDELAALRRAYANVVLEQGDTSREAQRLADEIDQLSGELNENRQRLSDAEDAADRLGDSLSDAEDAARQADDGFTVFKATLADLAADAIRAAIDGLKNLAGTIVELGMETERSFAQLETISGSENIDNLTEALTELSNRTGIASADLAITAYNAISAGTSAEDAAAMVETASKLAVAGFTDTDSALAVLTTAINSYGDSVGTAEEIADSLIQVQNLGVTTIGQLSSAMGKAIATGSAYGVNLANLESAYISLTKGGISTEESTTYLSSMLNELGDTGSDVAAILKAKTGSSFTELMKSGSSLSDVLEIVYKALDEDSTAMMNLWGSAEAGKASNAIINQGLETFNCNLETLADSAGATQSAYEIMTDTLSTKLSIMEQNFANLGLEIYDRFEPALSSAVQFVTSSVIPGIEWLLGHLPEVGVALGTIGAVIAAMNWGAIVGKLSKLSGAFSGLMSVLSKIPGPALAIIAVVAALTAGFMHLWETNEEFRDNVMAVWEKLQGSFSELGGTISGMIDQLMPLISQIAGTVLDAFGQIAAAVLPVLIQLVAEILPVIIGLISKLLPVLTVIIEKVLAVLVDVISKLLPLVMQIIEAVLPVLVEILNALTPILDLVISLLQPILNLVVSLVASILNLIMTAIAPLIEIFATLISAILQPIMPILSAVANIITSVLGAAIQAIQPIIESLTTVFQGLIDFITGVFSSNWSEAWNGIVQVFGGLWDNLAGIVKAPINAVIGLINKAIGALNNISVTIPDWVPVVGGDTFGIDIPTIPMLAAGGFTDGVSIAGEAGMEAVISFDKKYRSENVTIWEKAGQMLGTLGNSDGESDRLTSMAGKLLTLDDFSLGSLANDAGTVIYYDFSGFTWSPQFHDAGNDTDDFMAQLKAHEAEFFDWLEDFIQMREVAQYA